MTILIVSLPIVKRKVTPAFANEFEESYETLIYVFRRSHQILAKSIQHKQRYYQKLLVEVENTRNPYRVKALHEWSLIFVFVG